MARKKPEAISALQNAEIQERERVRQERFAREEVARRIEAHEFCVKHGLDRKVGEPLNAWIERLMVWQKARFAEILRKGKRA